MADYRAINTNDYSDIAGWEVSTDSGVTWAAATQLPTVADGVYANGFIKNVDIDAFASFYSNRTMLNVVVGGRFNINSGITMTGDVFSRWVLNLEGCVLKSTSGDSWVIGDIYGSDLNGNYGQFSTGGMTDGARVTLGTLNVVGSVYSGVSRGVDFPRGSGGIRAIGSGGFVVHGNAIVQTTTNNLFACRAQIGFSISDLSINPNNGIVLGRSTGAGSAVASYGITINECENLNSQCLVTGKFIMPTTNQPTWVNCKAKVGANVQIEIYDELDNPILCNPLFAQDQADEADVRLGTSYANGALTGTAAIPPAASVALNVPVDNTVGSYVLTVDTNAIISGITSGLTASLPSVLSQPLAEDLLTEISTSSNPVAERLRNTSTVQTTGAQIAALTIS